MDAESDSWLDVIVSDGKRSKTSNECRHARPAWFDTKMADVVCFFRAMVFDAFENCGKNLRSIRFLGWEYGPILDVIEAIAGLEEIFLHQGAAQDDAVVPENNREVFIADIGAKIRPPRCLHKASFRMRFQKVVPSFP